MPSFTRWNVRPSGAIVSGMPQREFHRVDGEPSASQDRSPVSRRLRPEPLARPIWRPSPCPALLHPSNYTRDNGWPPRGEHLRSMRSCSSVMGGVRSGKCMRNESERRRQLIACSGLRNVTTAISDSAAHLPSKSRLSALSSHSSHGSLRGRAALAGLSQRLEKVELHLVDQQHALHVVAAP